jgi:CheY-like chemotaxis protein
MSDDERPRPVVEILLVEDNPGDVRLTQEAFAEARTKNRIHVVSTGEDALKFLRREEAFKNAVRPELILLDLRLPGMGGREVLAHIKTDTSLRRIPVIVFAGSKADDDIQRAYHLNVNSYIAKPADADQYARVVRIVEDFWLSTVRLPRE